MHIKANLWLLFVIWIILNVLDYFSTLICSSLGGIEELNLLYQFINHWPTMIVVKMVLASAVGVVLVHYKSMTFFLALNIFLVAVCLYNLSVAYRLL